MQQAESMYAIDTHYKVCISTSHVTTLTLLLGIWQHNYTHLNRIKSDHTSYCVVTRYSNGHSFYLYTITCTYCISPCTWLQHVKSHLFRMHNHLQYWTPCTTFPDWEYTLSDLYTSLSAWLKLKSTSLILLWTIEHTMNTWQFNATFAHYGVHQAYKTENKRKGDNFYTSTVSTDWSVLFNIVLTNQMDKNV